MEIRKPLQNLSLPISSVSAPVLVEKHEEGSHIVSGVAPLQQVLSRATHQKDAIAILPDLNLLAVPPLLLPRTLTP